MFDNFDWLIPAHTMNYRINCFLRGTSNISSNKDRILLNITQMQKYELKKNQISTQSDWFIQFFKVFSSFRS